MLKKHILIPMLLITTTVLLMLSCAQRDDNMGIRNNPCDPGGESWNKNEHPVITVRTDSLWEEFNHSCTTGTIRFYLKEDDLNFPYDTVRGSIFINSKR